MICAIRYARENNVPYLGICLGMQLSIIEFARNVAGLNQADSIEFNPDTPDPVIAFLEGHSKALILGTGGVSKAVKYALDKMGIENKFVSRNSNFEIMGYYELSPSVMEEFDVIVNCTPMGMWPDVNQCPDIPYTFLSEKHLLLDVIANPDETMFMKKGREHGATAKGGKEMLEQQAVAAWEIWERIGE